MVVGGHWVVAGYRQESVIGANTGYTRTGVALNSDIEHRSRLIFCSFLLTL